MDIRTREAVRYLGYGRHAVDDKTLAMISDAFVQLDTIASAKSIYRIFALKIKGPNSILIGNMNIESNNLYKTMRGCKRAVVFGATLGTGVDMLMKKYTLIDMPKAVVLQACAAALLEEYCNECQEKIAHEVAAEGLYLRPRFSPGYGDFPIVNQEALLRLLDSSKTIGLTMTDGFMLTPLKSVTAVIGVSEEDKACHKNGCEVCEKEDCSYRRD